MIKIGDTLLDASLTRSSDTLTISMVGSMTLDALAALLEPASAPEVRVLSDAGETTAIYKNHAVTALIIEVIDDTRQVTATLTVEPIEQTEADRLREQLERAEGILGEHDAALVEVAGMAADGQQLTGEAEDALIELAALYASLEERVAALEAQSAPDETGEEVS